MNGILEWPIDKIFSCQFEEIVLNEHLFGYEFIMDVKGKIECTLRLFVDVNERI